VIPEATRPPTGYHLVSLDKASSHSGNAQSALLPQWFCYFGMIRNSIYRCRCADLLPQMAFRGMASSGRSPYPPDKKVRQVEAAALTLAGWRLPIPGRLRTLPQS